MKQKLKESQIREMVREALLEFKDTLGGDPDNVYFRPNGSTAAYSHELPGDRRLTMRYNKFDRNPKKREVSNGGTLYSKGKAKLCFLLNRKIEEMFGIDFSGKQVGKVNWTPDELGQIKKIQDEVRNLADMSKTEAAKQRHGVTDDAIASAIRESIDKVLKEDLE